MKRVTPDNILELKENEVFVYGANESYIHGCGAAKTAMRWGAKYYKSGLQGQTYGIPTKDKNIETLPLNEIQEHVLVFIDFAKRNLDLQFLVTQIGCGLACYEPCDIAPLFKSARDLQNVHLPKEFWDYLNKNFPAKYIDNRQEIL